MTGERWERPTEKLVRVLGAGIENSSAVPNVLVAAVFVRYLERRTAEAGLSWDDEEAGEAVSEVGRAFVGAPLAAGIAWPDVGKPVVEGASRCSGMKAAA